MEVQASSARGMSSHRSTGNRVAALVARVSPMGTGASALALLGLIVYLGVYLDQAWVLLGFPFSIDQGEGYDAYSGWLIHLGEWIYSDNARYPYYSSNYPPLYSYLISIPMAWLGPSLAVARAVSIVSTLATAMVIGLLVWRNASPAPRLSHAPASPRPHFAYAALAAGLLFLASPYVFHSTPLARVNALTLLLAVAALAVLERARGRQILLVSALLLAALYSKQTALDAFAAAAAWLLLRHRIQDTILLVGTVLAPGLGLLVALELLSGGHFWSNVVAGNANPWSLEQASGYYADFLWLHAVVLGLAVVQTAREARASGLSLFGLYFLAAAGLALTAGKWGAGESYFLAPLAAGCIQAGRLLPSLWPRPRLRSALGGLLLLQVALVPHGALADALGVPERGFQAEALGWRPGPEEVAQAENLLAYIRTAGGDVLSEDPGLVMAAGKPIVGNATHLRNLWQAGLWDEDRMVADLQAHAFEIVILQAELFPPPVLEAIGRHYYLRDAVQVHNHRYLVFLPGAQ